MGNIQSNKSNKSDTINWNNLRTDNMTSSQRSFNKLSNDAKLLISNLTSNINDLSTNSETVSEMNSIFKNLDQNDKIQINNFYKTKLPI